MERKDLTLEQEYTVQQFEEGHNVLVTGPAGTGKTLLIKIIYECALLLNKKVQVCALTACAAILLSCNASTLHSWTGIKLGRGTVDQLIGNILKNKKVLSRWRSTKVLIVDEISMLSKRLFELVNIIAQRVRNSPLPFGGLQLVFTGDFYQLPPVQGSEEGSGQFCFESDLWYQTFALHNHIELTTLFRQKDPIYKAILNNVRVGKVTQEDIGVLRDYLQRPFDKDMHNGCVPTKLYPTKNKVDDINQGMFQSIEHPSYEFHFMQKNDCTTYLDSNKVLPKDVLQYCQKELNIKKMEMEFDYLIKNCPCERILSLKKNANVMCTVNLDMESGICNGSIGTVVDFVTNGITSTAIPIVQFSNGVKRTMPLKYWQSEEFPTIAIAQIPLRLAWATTIHKCQGATLPMAEIDIGHAVFEYGQSYVALSRVQSLDGLYLAGFEPTRIKTNPKVDAFYSKIPKIEYEEDIMETNFEYKQLNLEAFMLDSR